MKRLLARMRAEPLTEPPDKLPSGLQGQRPTRLLAAQPAELPLTLPALLLSGLRAKLQGRPQSRPRDELRVGQ